MLGAIVAFAGLMTVPVTLVIVVGLLYNRYAELAAVRGAFTGVAAVAAGVVLVMAWRMAMLVRGRPGAVVIALLAFAGAGILRWPLWWIVAGRATPNSPTCSRSRRPRRDRT